MISFAVPHKTRRDPIPSSSPLSASLDYVTSSPSLTPQPVVPVVRHSHLQANAYRELVLVVGCLRKFSTTRDECPCIKLFDDGLLSLTLW